MAKNGLDKWFKQQWVDIGSKRKDFRGPKPSKAMGGPIKPAKPKMMGGGLTEATARLKRQGLKGGGICTKGMNREAVGKNS